MPHRGKGVYRNSKGKLVSGSGRKKAGAKSKERLRMKVLRARAS